MCVDFQVNGKRSLWSWGTYFCYENFVLPKNSKIISVEAILFLGNRKCSFA